MADLPCDADGMCMVCKIVPPDCDVLLCSGCVSPWHMRCLNPPMKLVPLGDWECPDCLLPLPSAMPSIVQKTVAVPEEDNLVSKIHAIQADLTLTEAEKAKKRQELMSKELATDYSAQASSANGDKKIADGNKVNATLEMMDNSLNCIFCIQLAERPVTTPCGHNFCLKCFQRWIGQGKKTCGKCRAAIPARMLTNPRINSALVMAIRMARSVGNSNSGLPKTYTYRDNDSRPDKCFTTSRAVKTGKANACSGKIFVTIAPDHFGPITAEHDPTRGQGVLVGECWEDRMECRQWGAHLPHVAGIAGQSDYGSQSVALSGGYEDDEDHGEWFLYTGSGGRDLSGNKRTNKEQSFDQKFDKMNEALRVSCKHGYPVRVVRSHKEKRSAYAPDAGVRYDGVYRIEMCWRKKGIQGHKVCRYLLVRCDNEPAPWTSDVHGDRPRPLPMVKELKSATDVFERRISPAWAYTEGVGWGWSREPPASKKTSGPWPSEATKKRKQLNVQQRLLKEFGCNACRKVLNQPISVPCGHNFCKGCLHSVYASQETRERKGVSGRTLRTQKVVKRCPNCKTDISDFLVSPQINRQMEEIIQMLHNSAKDEQGSDGVEDEERDYESTDTELQAEAKTAELVKSMPVVADAVENDQPRPKNAIPDVPSVPGNTRKVNSVTFQCTTLSSASADPTFLAICQAFPAYSEDLLRSILADQDGDMKELNSLLLALEEQRKQVQSRQRGRDEKGCHSGSEVLNGSDYTSKEQMEDGIVNSDGHSISEQVENAASSCNALGAGDPMQLEKTMKPQKKQRVDQTTKLNDRKRNRAPLPELLPRVTRSRAPLPELPPRVTRSRAPLPELPPRVTRSRAPLPELPPRVTRSRACKGVKVSHVVLISDDECE